jgi:Carboxypeptidase regulatory-like domain
MRTVAYLQQISMRAALCATLPILGTASPLAAQAQSPAAPSPTGSLQGRVLDQLGDPVPVAKVLVEDAEGRVLARTTADGEGVFACGRIPLQPAWRVTAEVPDHFARAAWLMPAPGANAATVQVFAAARMSGRVVDADGKAVPGASVVAAFDLSRLLAGAGGVTATTDKDGHYELDGVPLGTIDVRAWARGHVMATTQLHVSSACIVDLRLGKENGTTLHVVVDGLDPASAPEVRVALVAFLGTRVQTLPAELASGQLDNKGRLELAGLPDFDYQVRPFAERFTFTPAQALLAAGSREPTATFRAEPLGTVALQGVLRDATEHPLADQELVCHPAVGGRHAQTRTDAQGRFRMQVPVAPGAACIFWLQRSSAWVVVANVPPHGPVDGRALGCHTCNADPANVIMIHAVRAATVRGKVVDATRQPLRCGEVELAVRVTTSATTEWFPFATTQTDRDGAFVFPGLPGSDDELRASVDGSDGAGGSSSFHLAGGADHDVGTLQLTAPGTIEGAVQDGKGAPVVGARVLLLAWDLDHGRQGQGRVQEAISDAQGRYRFRGVAARGYGLQAVVGAAAASPGVELVDVAAGETKVVALPVK